jgi:hypothetical protein
MKLQELATAMNLRNLTPELSDRLSSPVRGGYVSDLLSDVLAHAPAGGVLVTVQVHLNVVAVAVHASLAGVVFAHGREPDEAVVRRAVSEGVPLFASGETAFDLVGRMHAAGLRGQEEREG